LKFTHKRIFTHVLFTDLVQRTH